MTSEKVDTAQGERAFAAICECFHQDFFAEPNMTLDARLRAAFDGLSSDMRAQARVYLDGLLASSRSSAELKGVWRRRRTALRLDKGARQWFTLLRDAL